MNEQTPQIACIARIVMKSVKLTLRAHSLEDWVLPPPSMLRSSLHVNLKGRLHQVLSLIRHIISISKHPRA